MSAPVIWTLRAILALGFALCLLVQFWVVPALADDIEYVVPVVAPLRLPGMAVAVLLVACAEVVLVCIARLLTMTAKGQIFRPMAFRYVNAIIGALLAAVVLTVIAAVLCTMAEAMAPALVLLLGLMFFGALAAALLMIVMRGLLATATALEGEMAEVV